MGSLACMGNGKPMKTRNVVVECDLWTCVLMAISGGVAPGMEDWTWYGLPSSWTTLRITSKMKPGRYC